MNKDRVVSLDAFRGFIMLSMLAGTLGLKELAHLPAAGVVYTQLTHAAWEGFHFEDLILPAFLFIIGCAMSLSFEKRRSQGATQQELTVHALKRAAALFILGFLLSWFSAGKPYIGAGVLQVLALSYIGGYFCSFGGERARWTAFGALLFVYWFGVLIFKDPEAGRNSYVVFQNIVYRFDDFMTHSATRWGYLYTIITSAAVVVYGGITGLWIGGRASNAALLKKLLIAGAVLTIAGIVLNPVIPIIKRMFTPSYAVMTCGLATLLLALFFYLIDMRGVKAWAWPFIVLGANSIFVYLLNGYLGTWLTDAAVIYTAPLKPFLGLWVDPLNQIIRLAIEWLLCLELYRRSIFLRL